MVAPQLVRLLRRMTGDVGFVPIGEAPPAADAACLLMSVPHLLGATDSEGLGRPYLTAGPDEVARWRRWLAAQPLAPSALRVGVCWAGNPAYALDNLRSVPPALLAPLAAVPDMHWVAWQPRADAAAMPGARLSTPGNLDDLACTAALIMALDLVVTVDTVIAHLAGALGREVWLLNRFNTCWRWQSGTRNSLWHGSLRQFRQGRPRDWETPVAEMAAALRERVQAGSRVGSWASEP